MMIVQPPSSLKWTEHQEALNDVQNSIYRKALKVCAVQSLCQLNLTDVPLIQDVMLNYQCQTGKQSSLPVQQLLKLLKVLFKRVRLEKPGQVEPKAPELTMNFLTAAYDRNGEGFVQPNSAAAALIALSGDSLFAKYRALFQLYAGRSYNRDIHITRNSTRTLLVDLLQILAVVGESCNFSHVEVAVHSCFSGVKCGDANGWRGICCGTMLVTVWKETKTAAVPENSYNNFAFNQVMGSEADEERFLTWLQSEPPILLWLPTCHRYRCLKCLNFDLCQVCFFTGQHRKPHKKSHPMMEHCVPVSAKENAKLFFRTIRNNLRHEQCRRKEARRRKALMMIGEDDLSIPNHGPSWSVPPISTKKPVPPDLLQPMHTLDLQQHRPLHHEVSMAGQMENDQSLKENPANQTASSIEADMVKIQELMKALHSERRYMRKQLNKWKETVQQLCFTQEDRNCKLEAKIQDLIVSQESLKVALQEMRQELKKITPYRKDPFKERNVWNRSGSPLLTASATRYSIPKPSGSPKISMKSELFKNANPEVAHCKNTGERDVPPGKHFGDEKHETCKDHLSQITISSPYCSAATEMLFDEKETEEEKELQLLMMKLRDALSLRVQSGQPSGLKEKVLSAAECMSTSLSTLTGQVVLSTRKTLDAGTGLLVRKELSN